MSRVILDTNAYSRMRKGDHVIADSLEEFEMIHLSVVVMGELYHGFHGGTKLEANVSELKRFMNNERVNILDVNADTALCYGIVIDTLRRQGTPIPSNDIWIAAQAMETGSVLLTFDQHFKHVPGLRLWRGLA